MNDNKNNSAIAPDGLWHHLRASILATLVLAVICCGIYPLIVWGLSQALFPDKANGSLIIDKDGNVIGSRLIGQAFSDAKYFHPRPSAAGNGYDPTASGGSNLGPTSAKLLSGTTKPITPGGPSAVDYDGIKLRVVLYCQENNIPLESSRPLKPFQDDKGNYDQPKLIEAFNHATDPLTIRAEHEIPADAVTASASGLDPHISPENARLQAPRVAEARKLTPAQVQQLIDQNTDRPSLGILGESAVNVLTLNLALDKLSPRQAD